MPLFHWKYSQITRYFIKNDTQKDGAESIGDLIGGKENTIKENSGTENNSDVRNTETGNDGKSKDGDKSNEDNSGSENTSGEKDMQTHNVYWDG